MRGKKIYIIVAAAFIVFLGYKYLDSRNYAEFVRSPQGMVYAPGWNRILAENVNGGRIILNVDGNEADVKGGDMFMDTDMNMMIDVEKLTPLLSCAVNRYEEDSAVIEKGSSKVCVSAGSRNVTCNGEDYELDASPELIDGRLYVPVSLIGSCLPYDYSWNPRMYTASLTNRKPDEKIYPYMYSYREDGRISTVKNQGDLGTCWAFASLTALESALLPENEYDFSEDHMTFHNGYNLSQSEGGEYNMSMAYLAAWKGPVLEEDDPYGDGYSPDGISPVFHVQEMQIIESKNFDGIKKAVFLYGGVQSSLYMSINDAWGNSSGVYNADNYSYCYIGTQKANHDVVIIGWDDSYPASSFATPPEGDGAFICINSWGDNFGDNGYFYVSYYDSNIGVHNLVYTGIENTDNYDNIYQSDLCGWVGQMGYGREYALFANVYEARSNEMLKAVGFYATGPDTEYEVYFVDNFEGVESFEKKVPVASGLVSNAGYYTVDIDGERFLMEGRKYAVAVKITTPNSVHPIAIEYRADRSTSTVDVTDGEGYISLGGRSWEHVEETQKCNVCLKAYTDNIEKNQ